MIDTFLPSFPRLSRRRLLTSAPCLARVFAAPAATETAAASPREIHISVEGNDFGALAAAVTAARKQRLANPDNTIVVDLPERLMLNRTLVLGQGDSGRANTPLIFRGAAHGTIITGGREIAQLPRNAASEAIIERMPASVRGRVQVYSLLDLVSAIHPPYAAFDSSKGRPSGRLFIFEGEQRLTPARWPSEGYLTHPMVVGDPTASTLTIALAAPPAGFESERDIWVDGFWGWNWWIERSLVDPLGGGHFSIARPNAPINSSARFAFINVASGLDGPGKVYVDDAGGHIYLIPTVDQMPTAPIVETLVHITGANNINFEGIAFEKTIGTTVEVKNSQRIVFSDSWFGHSGTHGLTIEGGQNNQVKRCIVADTGYGGISVSGGDSATLQPAGHLVEHCCIHQFSKVLPAYKPGIYMSGVGVTVVGNEIAYGPHAGILFYGNDHRIVGNVLHHLVQDTEDAGAIYGGRNWATRGTLIANNFFHDITNRAGPSKTLVHGVYLDDELPGITVADNVFVNVDQPILVGGGRDNTINDNLGLGGRGDAMIHIDSRGLGWQKRMTLPNGTLWKSMQLAPEQMALYSERYSGFSTTLTDRPGAPINNRFIGNLSDKAPVVLYKPPDIREVGQEIKSRLVYAQASAFPFLSDFLPADDPAYSKLEQTRQTILKTLGYIYSHAFLNKTQK